MEDASDGDAPAPAIWQPVGQVLRLSPSMDLLPEPLSPIKEEEEYEYDHDDGEEQRAKMVRLSSFPIPPLTPSQFTANGFGSPVNDGHDNDTPLPVLENTPEYQLQHRLRPLRRRHNTGSASAAALALPLTPTTTNRRYNELGPNDNEVHIPICHPSKLEDSVRDWEKEPSSSRQYRPPSLSSSPPPFPRSPYLVEERSGISPPKFGFSKEEQDVLDCIEACTQENGSATPPPIPLRSSRRPSIPAYQLGAENLQEISSTPSPLVSRSRALPSIPAYKLGAGNTESLSESPSPLVPRTRSRPSIPGYQLGAGTLHDISLTPSPLVPRSRTLPSIPAYQLGAGNTESLCATPSPLVPRSRSRPSIPAYQLGAENLQDISAIPSPLVPRSRSGPSTPRAYELGGAGNIEDQSATPPPIPLRSHQRQPGTPAPRYKLSPFPTISPTPRNLGPKPPQRKLSYPSPGRVRSPDQLYFRRKVEGGESEECFVSLPLRQQRPEVPQAQLPASSPASEKFPSAERSPTKDERQNNEEGVGDLPQLPLSIINTRRLTFSGLLGQADISSSPPSNPLDDFMMQVNQELESPSGSTKHNSMDYQNRKTGEERRLWDEGSVAGNMSEIERMKMRRPLEDVSIDSVTKEWLEAEGEDERDDWTDTHVTEDMAAFFSVNNIEEGKIKVTDADADASKKLATLGRKRSSRWPAEFSPPSEIPQIRGGGVEKLDLEGRHGGDRFLKVGMRAGPDDRPVSTSTNSATSVEDEDARKWNQFWYPGTVRAVTPSTNHQSERPQHKHRDATYSEDDQERPYGDSPTTPRDIYNHRTHFHDHGSIATPGHPGTPHNPRQARLGSPFISPAPQQRPPPPPAGASPKPYYTPDREDWCARHPWYAASTPVDRDRFDLHRSVSTLEDRNPNEPSASSRRRKNEPYSPVSPYETRIHGSSGIEQSLQQQRRPPPFNPRLHPGRADTRYHDDRSQAPSPLDHGSLDAATQPSFQSSLGRRRSNSAPSVPDSAKASQGPPSYGRQHQGPDPLRSDMPIHPKSENKAADMLAIPGTSSLAPPHPRPAEKNARDDELFMTGQAQDSHTRHLGYEATSNNRLTPTPLFIDRHSIVSDQSMWTAGNASEIGPTDSISLIGDKGKQLVDVLPKTVDTTKGDIDYDDAKERCRVNFNREIGLIYRDHGGRLRQIDESSTPQENKVKLKHDEEVTLIQKYNAVADRTGYSRVDKNWAKNLPGVSKTGQATVPSQEPRQSMSRKIGNILRWTMAIPDDPDVKSYSQRKPPVVGGNAISVGAVGAIGYQAGSVSASLDALQTNRRRKTSVKSKKSDRKASSEVEEPRLEPRVEPRAPSRIARSAGSAPPSIRNRGLPRSLQAGASSPNGFAHSEATFIGSPQEMTFEKDKLNGEGQSAASDATVWPTQSVIRGAK